MAQIDTALKLGTILCRHCGRIIGELDTQRVINFFTECKESNCHKEETAEAD